MQPDIFHCDVPGTETLPAHRLTCYGWGDPSASEVVICSHGLTRNGRDFDFLAQALSARFGVACPDMPGRGQSQHLALPAAYNYATYISDMLCLLMQLKYTKVHWVGTSMGGIIGMTLANSIPGLITSLVLNDIGCVIPAAGLKRILSYAGVNTVFDTRQQAEAALRENCKPFGITREEHWQHVFRHSLVEENGKVRLAYDPTITATFPKADAVEDTNLWGVWEGVSKVPTLLIRGEHSDILTKETATQMQAKHPNLTYYEVKNAGHAPALMDEAQIATVCNWIESR